MAQPLDASGNVIINGMSTNMTPSQYSASIPTTVPTSSLATPTKSINPVQPNYDVNGMVSGSNTNLAYTQNALADAQKQAQDIADQKKAEAAAANTDVNRLASTLNAGGSNLANSTVGDVYANTGVNDKLSILNRLNAESLGLGYTRDMIPLQIQNQSIGLDRTDRGIAPLQTKQLRDNAIQLASNAYQAAIAKADYETAKSKADQMIAYKYDTTIAEINAKKTNLENIRADLTTAEKKLADATTARLNKQLKDEERKMADEKDVAKLIIDASPYAPASVLSQAKKLQAEGKSSVEVAITLGKYGGDYLGDLVKRSTIAKNDADYQKTMKEIKELGKAPQVTAPTGSNANFIQNLAASAVNKESLSAGEREKISKSFAVVGQLGNLSKALQKDQTSFFGGKVKEIKAALGQDANAGAIQAQITALVPQVARGTFGEVGVLTDADISNYKKVIGNLSSPNSQNAAVTAMTLTALRNGVKAQLDTAAASKLDVSRFAPMYQDLTNQINQINDEIGVTDSQVREYMVKNPQTQQMIEQLIVDGVKGSEILQILGVEN
jgi:hypothetical protein